MSPVEVFVTRSRMESSNKGDCKKKKQRSMIIPANLTFETLYFVKEQSKNFCRSKISSDVVPSIDKWHPDSWSIDPLATKVV